MTNIDIMNLDGRLLAVFCAAAEELHFGRAAARLFMSQPPFSQQVKRLEDLVGAKLFIRTTRTVRLTPAGQVMYQHARQISGETELMLRAVRQAARGEAGSLVIGLTPTAACSPLAEALYHYRTAHPEIELDLREMNSNAMEASIRMHAIDVALMRPTRMDADIRAIEIFQEPMVLAVRRDHAWAGRPRVPVEDIADIPLVGYLQSTSPYFRDMLQSMFGHTGKRPRVVQESALPTLLTLVEAGIGAAIVPWTISRARGGSLQFLPLRDRSNSVARIVVACLRAPTNPAVEGFAAAMRQAHTRLADQAQGEGEVSASGRRPRKARAEK
ncbi:LysR family transcriptional regulator [Polaromonas sp. YR568]|uniref:LysR family transcriptional regulator n=1 Tax=Polaromonas sp. YR568 TaxID=1855301 RepID=UPI00398BE217